MTSKSPKDIFTQFASLAGPGLESLNNEVRQQVRATVQNALEKMDVVTREDFEAQKAVLIRTREKLEALELTVADLEARLKEASQKNSS